MTVRDPCSVRTADRLGKPRRFPWVPWACTHARGIRGGARHGHAYMPMAPGHRVAASACALTDVKSRVARSAEKRAPAVGGGPYFHGRARDGWRGPRGAMLRRLRGRVLLRMMSSRVPKPTTSSRETETGLTAGNAARRFRTTSMATRSFHV